MTSLRYYRTTRTNHFWKKKLVKNFDLFELTAYEHFSITKYLEVLCNFIDELNDRLEYEINYTEFLDLKIN